MRLLICGSRYWTDKALIKKYLVKLKPEVVIEGEADGADKLSREASQELGIIVLPFPANWEKYGRVAGPIRNKQMLDEGKPDLVLAFHSDLSKSKGTKNMITQAKKKQIKVVVVTGWGE